MAFASISPCGGGVMQCHAISTSAQAGVTAGTIVAGGDTQGFYLTTDKGTHWQPRSKGAGAAQDTHQVAGIMWSSQEVNGGVAAIYAATGDAGSATSSSPGGGLMVSTDLAASWQLRTTAVQFAGNKGAPPLPTGGYPRPAGRLLAEDSSFLYASTYGTGVKRSASHGADNFPVTFTMAGAAPGAGSWFCRAMYLDPASGNLYVAVYPTTSSGGLWQCTAPHASAPDFTRVTLPVTGGATGRGTSNGTGPEVEDIIVVDGVIYLACGSQGLWSNYGGSWHDLSGTDVNTSTGYSVWSSLDGYLDGSGNHVIVAACSHPATPANECAIILTIASHGTGAITYKHQGTTTLSPVPGYGAAWCPTSGTCFSQQGFANPMIRFDPNDTARLGIFLSGSMGFYRSADASTSWTIANNGDPAFRGHAVAADPWHAGHVVFGDSDWGGWDVTDGVGASGNITRVDNGQNFANAFDPGSLADHSDSVVYAGYGGKYANPNTGGLVTSRPWNSATTTSLGAPFTKCPLGLAAFRLADGTTRAVLAAVVGDGMWRGTSAGGAWTWTRVSSVIATVITGNGTTTGLRYPMAYEGGGIVFCWDRMQGIFRSTDYGVTWTLIWAKTAKASPSSAEIAVNPRRAGELWVSANDALYKLTGCDSPAATVTNGGITATAATDPAVTNNGPVAFDTAGNLYCATRDTGGGATLVQLLAGGTAWADITGDNSATFARGNSSPENMAIGPDGHIYVSGSNAISQGFAATVGNPSRPLAVLTEQSAAAAAVVTTPFGALAEQSASTTAGPGGFAALTEQSAGFTSPGGANVPVAFAASGSASWTPLYLLPSNGSGIWQSGSGSGGGTPGTGYPAVYGPVYT